MLLEKTCPICGNSFTYPHWRKNAKYCSVACAQKGLHAPNNVTCTYCGKHFHKKQSSIDRYARRMGIFCSRKCETEYRKVWFSGENNHQFGLKGELNSSFKGQETNKTNHNIVDIYVYSPEHPFANATGRVAKHRLVVEEHFGQFDPKWFIEIDGKKLLRKDVIVHHKDGNHSNNDINNLEICTRGEHTQIHNKTYKNITDPKTGRIVGRKLKST